MKRMSGPKKSRRSRDNARQTNPPLCSYRLMWLLVMFDLPVVEPEERKAANDFRHELLDMGFERCQFSVYLRFCEGREQAATWTRHVQRALPTNGKVYCLVFTDKQYGEIIRFEHRRTQPNPPKPAQFVLF
jgi:CRISPR-associated protein Cas2